MVTPKELSDHSRGWWAPIGIGVFVHVEATKLPEITIIGARHHPMVAQEVVGPYRRRQR